MEIFAIWLSDSGPNGVLPKHFVATMKGKQSILNSRGKFGAGEFRNPELEMLRLQYEAPEMIQTIMRTALRDDLQASVNVWLPGSNLRKVGMLLDYFTDAKVEIDF